MPSQDPSPPGVFLKALTPEAREALGRWLLAIPRFPFRVGRERRLRERLERWTARNRRTEPAQPTNDLYVRDPDDPPNLSPRHFAIHDIGEVFSIEDLESDAGLIVEGVPVGKARIARKAELHPEDVIIAGGSRSPFVFKFLVRRGKGSGAGAGSEGDHGSARRVADGSAAT